MPTGTTSIAHIRPECKPKLRTEFLASGLVAVALGYGDAEILVGIDGRVVDADFVVQVGAGGASAHANVADGVAAMDLLSGRDSESRKVAVASGNAVAVIDHDGFAVSAQKVGEGYYAVGGRDDGMTERAANINAAVKCAFSVEWVDALAETAGNLAVNRPQAGR